MANGHIKKSGFKQWLYQYGYIIYLFLLSLFVSLLSRQCIFYKTSPGTDSSVFLTISKGMTSGGVPYRDFFDHKGPLLYVLNFIGYSMGGIRGIWFVEIISIAVTVFFVYASIKKIYGSLVAICATTLGTISLHLCLEGGNLVEEYALPFIAIALYLFISIILDERITIWKVLVGGFTFALSLMLRPNMFAVWFVFSAFFVLSALQKKKVLEAVKYVAVFTLGTVIGLFPFVVYLWCNNAFGDFIFQCFIFNYKYAKNGGVYTLIKNVLQIPFALNSLVIISLLSSIVGIFTKDKRKRTIFALLFLSLVASILLVATSQYQFGHYYIVFIPLISIGISSFFALFKNVILSQGISKNCASVIVIGVMLFTVFVGTLRIGRYFVKSLDVTVDKEKSEMMSIINENSKAGDSLIVLSNDCSLYLYTDLKPANKFIYDHPICDTSVEVAEQFKEEWVNSKPTFVIEPKSYASSDTEYVKWVINELEENYRELFDTENYIIYQLDS